MITTVRIEAREHYDRDARPGRRFHWTATVTIGDEVIHVEAMPSGRMRTVYRVADSVGDLLHDRGLSDNPRTVKVHDNADGGELARLIDRGY